MIIGWIIAAVVAVVVGGAALMKKMQARMKGKQGGMMIAKEGGSNPIKMVYGKRRISTDNAWKGVSKLSMKTSSGWDSAYLSGRESRLNRQYKKNVFLHRLDVWCQGPIHSIGNYKIDGDKTSHTRFANGGEAWARILTKHGNPNQTMFPAMSSGFNEIGSEMKAEGLCWSWNRFFYDPENPEYQGEPNLTAEVQGLKVWDPRTHPNDPTIKSWSDNSALCLLDYLLADYGRELALSDIDIPTFMSAANSCDAVVDLPEEPTAVVPTTIYWALLGISVEIPPGGLFPDHRLGQPVVNRKRYTTNLILESDNSTIDNCAEILKTMKGSLPFVNGKYKLLMEEEGTSVMSFDNDNILGGVNLGWADRSKRTNRVTVKFPNENKGYQDDTVSWPPAHSALHVAYKAYDNDEDLHSEFELTGVTDFYQARDMAEFAVRESRSQEYITFKTQPQAMALECGDVITVSNDAMDIVEKLYRVRETSMNADLTVTVKAQIYDPTIYPWSVGDEEAEAVTLTMTPSLFDQPAAMENLQATTATLLNGDGTALTEATVTWDEIETGTSEIDYVEIGYKLNAETVYIWAILPAESLSHTITGLQDVQLYNLAARYRNSVGKFSEVVVVNIGTLEAGTNLDAAAVAAQAAADAAAVAAAQALTDSAAAAALLNALDFSSYLTGSDLPDVSGFISQAEVNAAQLAAETYADNLTTNLQTAAQVSAAISADETVIDGARITTGTINAARISLSGHNTSELTNNSGYATGTEVATAVSAIDLSGYVANGDLSGYVTTLQGTALVTAANTYADGLTTNLQTAAQVSAAISADTTSISGSRITTGTVAAARISISGLNASALNNDAFAVPSDIPSIAGLATTAEVTAAQAAAATYADGLTSGLQSAAQVSAAISADTTSISGSRITTGTINAARISLSGRNISELTNDSNFALSSAIPVITNLQTAAQVTAAIQADTTSINGSRITTGSISAGRISGGTLDFNQVNANNLFVSNLKGDVNTLIPFKKQQTQTIPYLTSSTSFTIFTGTIPASGTADVKRKPYFSATGWGVFQNDDVYKLELFMRVNDPAPSSTSAGRVVTMNSTPGSGFVPEFATATVSGNYVIAAGTTLQDSASSGGSSPRTLGQVWFTFYNAALNRTSISYSRGTTYVLSSVGRYIIVPPAANGFQLVNEFFFRSPFDYDPLQFALNGALNETTEYSVSCEVKVRLFNQEGSGRIPDSQPSTNWNNDRIYNISGVMMALR